MTLLEELAARMSAGVRTEGGVAYIYIFSTREWFGRLFASFSQVEELYPVLANKCGRLLDSLVVSSFE